MLNTSRIKYYVKYADQRLLLLFIYMKNKVFKIHLNISFIYSIVTSSINLNKLRNSLYVSFQVQGANIAKLHADDDVNQDIDDARELLEALEDYI